MPTMNVSPDDQRASTAALSPFAKKLLAFIETRQAQFHEQLKARMPGVSAEQADAMFESAARALDKARPTAQGLTVRERDAINISVLTEVLGSKILATAARQYHKLELLKQSIGAVDGVYNEQLDVLKQKRNLSPEASVKVEDLSARLLLDSVASHFPAQTAATDLSLYRDMGITSRDLTTTLTDNARPDAVPAMLAIRGLQETVIESVKQIAMLSDGKSAER